MLRQLLLIVFSLLALFCCSSCRLATDIPESVNNVRSTNEQRKTSPTSKVENSSYTSTTASAPITTSNVKDGKTSLFLDDEILELVYCKPDKPHSLDSKYKNIIVKTSSDIRQYTQTLQYDEWKKVEPDNWIGTITVYTVSLKYTDRNVLLTYEGTSDNFGYIMLAELPANITCPEAESIGELRKAILALNLTFERYVIPLQAYNNSIEFLNQIS